MTSKHSILRSVLSVFAAIIVASNVMAQTPPQDTLPGDSIDATKIDTSEIVAQLSANYSAALVALNALSNSSLLCRQDSDCVAVALGAKACGGPSGYFITSKYNDFYVGGEIESLAKKTEKYQDELNRYLGLISDCAMEMPPAMNCDRRARACVVSVN